MRAFIWFVEMVQGTYRNILPTGLTISESPAQQLSSPWTSADIGSVPTSGEAYDSGGVLTIKGSGDVNGTADTFQFVYQTITGDRELICQVQSFEGESQWRRVGLMVRQGTATGAIYAHVSLDGRSNAGVRFQTRTVADAQDDNGQETGLAQTPPLWLRLVRNAGVVTGYYGSSSSGPWTQVGSGVAVSFTGSVLYGVACSSGNITPLATATTTLPSVNTVSADAGTLAFTVASQNVDEDGTSVTVTVARSGGTSGAASVNLGNAGTGSAVAGTDFTDPGFPVALSWSDAEGGNKTQAITILDRAGVQANRTLDLTLSGESGASLGAQTTQTITIVDTDDADPALPEGSNVYFVNPDDPSASNSNNGLYATFQSGTDGPWASLAAVQSKTFTASEECYIKVGTTYTGSSARLTNATLAGNSGHRFVLGAFYDDSGTPRRGLGGGVRPIIRGTSNWYAYNGTGTVTRYPATQFDAMILMNGNDYLTIENLHVRHSGGRGIYPDSADNVRVTQCIVSETWDQAIYFEDCTNTEIDNNQVTGAGFVKKVAGTGTSAVSVRRGQFHHIHDNTLWDNFGTEGIDIFSLGGQPAFDFLVEDNVVLDTAGVHYYLDGGNRGIWRRNLAVSTGRTNYFRSSGNRGIGFYISDEVNLTTQSENVIFYSNISVGNRDGISVADQGGASTHAEIYVIGNLFLENDWQHRFRQGPWSGNVFSNMYVTLTAGLSDVDATTLDSVTVDANYFSQGDPGGDWSDPQNVYGSVAFTGQSTVDWRNLENETTADVNDHYTLAQVQQIVSVVEAGVVPTAGGDWEGAGTAIASRTFPSAITWNVGSGVADTDYNGTSYSNPDIGPFAS